MGTQLVLSFAKRYFFNLSNALNSKHNSQTIRILSPYRNISLFSFVFILNSCAFKGCSSLQSTILNKSVILTDSTGNTYEDIFEDCSGDITIDCSISDVSGGLDLDGSPDHAVDAAASTAFSRSKFNTITIGSSVTKIGFGYFHYVDFDRINIGDNVTEIGECAFYGASGDIGFTSKSKLNKIAAYAFCDCNFKDFVIPESVTKIEKYAFKESIGDNFTIGSQVTEIGAYAFEFSNIANLVTIKCDLSNTTSIGEDAFDNYYFSSLRIIGNYEKLNVTMTRNISDRTMDKIFIEGTIKDISNTWITIKSLNELHLCKSVQDISQFLTIDSNSVGIKKVYSAPTTPPTLGDLVAPFSESTIIYVPKNSVEQYKTAANWEKFAGNIVGYDF